MQAFLLRLKRADTPLFRWLKKAVVFVLNDGRLPVPESLMPLLRSIYKLQQGLGRFVATVWNRCYQRPLFVSRCERVGKNFEVDDLPYVMGHAGIEIGDDVAIGAGLMVATGRFIDHPVFRIGNRVRIGERCLVSVNQQVLIGDDVEIGEDVRISDNDGHPREADLRAAHAPLEAKDIRPVEIGSRVFIGGGARIMKGVRVGDGARVLPESVVIAPVPAGAIVGGNPAEILKKASE